MKEEETNDLAEKYDEIYPEIELEKRHYKEAVQELINDPGKKVLDVGAGAGGLEKIAEEVDELSGKKFTSIDISKEGLKRISEEREASAVKADARSLPFEDNSFDTTVCMGTLGHLDNKSESSEEKSDREKAIDEMDRVTKNKLILGIPVYTSKTKEKEAKKLIDWLKEHPAKETLTKYEVIPAGKAKEAIKNLENKLEEKGFKIERFKKRSHRLDNLFNEILVIAERNETKA